MREIKFRGKTRTTEGEKWVYGYLYKVKSFFDEDENCYIRNEHINDFIVDKDTVGQYTGLKDKNGVEIYDGDIVKVTLPDNRKEIGCVEYDEDYCEYKVAINNYEYVCLWKMLQFEILGNIYDNPELLEKEGK